MTTETPNFLPPIGSYMEALSPSAKNKQAFGALGATKIQAAAFLHLLNTSGSQDLDFSTGDHTNSSNALINNST